MNQNGMSIVSVMVAAGLLGIISLGVIRIMDNANKGQQSVEGNIEFSILKSSILKIIENPELCDTAFVDGASPPQPIVFNNSPGAYPTALQTIDKVRLGSSASSPVIAEIGKRFNGGLTIQNMGLRQMADRNSTMIPGKHIYEVAFIIEMSRSAKAYGGRTLSNTNNPFLMTIQTDAGTNRLESCSPSSGAGGPSEIDLLWSGSVGGGGGRSTGTINFNAGMSLNDYRRIAVFGRGTNSTQPGQQGRGYFEVDIEILRDNPGEFFANQTFSGDDSGSLEIKYNNDTSIRWGTFRQGRIHKIYGIK